MSDLYPSKTVSVNINAAYYKGAANLRVSTYWEGGGAAIVLESETDGPLCTLTRNLPDIELQEGTFVVKDCDENAGILESLIAEGVMEDTGEVAYSGWLTMPICRFCPSFLDAQREGETA